MNTDSNQSEAMRTRVREGYAQIAAGGCCAPQQGATTGCCAPSAEADQLAAAIGYDIDQLTALPEGANLGLSCGNPGAIAAQKPGEIVLDLGSGAGFDAFLCGPKVGTEGRVIGVDMTPAMLDRARANASSYRERSGLDNVKFRLGEIEHLPLPDASVDVVISNCVINLSVDKPQVWREIARVLKPGGRVAVSDMALHRPLPEGVKTLVENWIGCIAGAITIDAYRTMIADAELQGVTITPKPSYVDTLVGSQDPLYQQVVEALPAGSSAADYITSVDVAATKGCCRPGSCC